MVSPAPKRLPKGTLIIVHQRRSKKNGGVEVEKQSLVYHGPERREGPENRRAREAFRPIYPADIGRTFPKYIHDGAQGAIRDIEHLIKDIQRKRGLNRERAVDQFLKTYNGTIFRNTEGKMVGVVVAGGGSAGTNNLIILYNPISKKTWFRVDRRHTVENYFMDPEVYAVERDAPSGKDPRSN